MRFAMTFTKIEYQGEKKKNIAIIKAMGELETLFNGRLFNYHKKTITNIGPITLRIPLQPILKGFCHN